MKIIIRLLYLFCLQSLLSCSVRNEQKTLAITDSLLTTRPDSALKLLDEMENVGQMSEAGVMHYAWNHAMAHYLMGISLVEDSLVSHVVDYYRQQGDVAKLLDGYLLKASYLQWTRQDRAALKELEEGIKIAHEQSNAGKWAQLVEQKVLLLNHSGNYAKAAKTAQMVLNGHYSLDRNMRGRLLYALGISLSHVGDMASDSCFKESISLSMEGGEEEKAAERILSYADVLAARGDYVQSNRYLFHCQRFVPKYADSSAIYVSLANNYINLHQLDSAQIYLGRAETNNRGVRWTKQGNLSHKASIEQLRNILNFGSGKPVSSHAFQHYCDSVTTVMIENENLSLRRLEARNRLQAANYELHRSRLLMLLGVVLLFLVLLGGIGLAYWLYRRKYQRLAEAEERIGILTDMLDKAQQLPSTERGDENDEVLFRKVLLQQLGIIRLVASTPTQQNQALLKRISAISGGEIPTHDLLVWPDLYPVIDRLYNQFYTRLMHHYGNLLTEKETQICCLLCAGFSTKEISVVTQQTSATIYVRKTSIRKKIGVPEGEDIIAFINVV
ncbi:helix-turn-helix transcriptional regulator [Prevotella veroralis]|jgi:hypothetical protein|uniref:Transcriptional regulator, LuxR family n=1 Tax=Prevotella veroralis F0319 TaxID=649761 RepID=C9MTN8_9BACT|nr:LuxR C-terminal-related transcriptional regulator [Prevotella veroralis]EEX17145.1 transcriptional regulator, LuxR family [Prevotella veroralis F0319]QUB41933.1 LuxR family transcriptional regulator [Prevotella veroralis]